MAYLPSIVIHNLPAEIDTEKIKLFFLDKKNGGSGDVEEVQYPLDRAHKNSARITFSHDSTVARICSAERVMKGKKLRLEAENIQVSMGEQELITPVNGCTKHSKKPLDHVCKEQGCVGKLYCARCIRDEHKHHAWTLLEDEFTEKRAEIDGVVLPELRSNVDALETAVDALKTKLQQVDKSFQGELKTVKDDEKRNQDKLKAEYDANQKKLEDDFNKQRTKITQEAKKVTYSIADKWEPKKKALGAAEKKCSQHLNHLRSEVVSVERSRIETDLRPLLTTIARARKCCEDSEDMKTLSQTSATLPATTFNLGQFAALGLVVTPKPRPQHQPAAQQTPGGAPERRSKPSASYGRVDTLRDLDPAVVFYLEKMTNKGYGVIKDPKDYGLVRVKHSPGDESCKVLFFDGAPRNAKSDFQHSYGNAQRKSVSDRICVPGMCTGIVDRKIRETDHRRPNVAAVRVGEEIRLRGTADAIDREIQQLEWEVIDGSCEADCPVCGTGDATALWDGYQRNRKH